MKNAWRKYISESNLKINSWHGCTNRRRLTFGSTRRKCLEFVDSALLCLRGLRKQNGVIGLNGCLLGHDKINILPVLADTTCHEHQVSLHYRRIQVFLIYFESLRSNTEYGNGRFSLNDFQEWSQDARGTNFSSPAPSTCVPSALEASSSSACTPCPKWARRGKRTGCRASPGAW